MGNRVQSVERALKLLMTIAKADTPPTVQEMATKSGVNRATAWRLLNTLEYFSLVHKDERSGTYKLGLGSWQLYSTSNLEDFTNRSRSVLQDVVDATGGNAFLEIASQGEIIVIDEVKPSSPIQVDLAGLVVPFYCSSIGKLYLSTLDEAELNQYLLQDFRALTKHTITDKLEIKKQITQAGNEKVAYNYKEHQEEWCAITSAVVDDSGNHFAYVGLTLPAYSTTKKELYALKNIMLQAAQNISKLI
ncbi:MAG: hypothetical protein RL147_1090 [Actinomycetota bacterium]|jgi:DNA-binding IclR family transcriptional regulator